MFSYPIIPDNSEAQHSSISIYIPSAGRSFMLEFLLWSSKKHLVRCLPNSKVFLVICCSDFVFQERSSIWLILREDQFIFENHGSWSDMLDALVSWWIFSKQPWASVQIKADGSLNFFEVIRSLSADSVCFLPLHYFDLKSDWLPLFTFLFGSPPEDLLFLYLLFVSIR